MTVGQFMHEVQFTRPAMGAIHFFDDYTKRRDVSSRHTGY